MKKAYEMEKDTNEGKLLMGKYRLERLVGTGGWGKVYRALHTKAGDTVAIKILDKKELCASTIRHTVKEIAVMRSLRHPNIVQLYEVMATKTKIYLVMEYVSGGDFFHKLRAAGWFEEDEARKYFHQLIRAVDFCHSRGVYHRDLKPENLLVDGDGNMKVTDFGLSTLKKNGVKLHRKCGTPEYIAPEVLTDASGYDGAKADIWSCGIILYMFLEGHYPFLPNIRLFCNYYILSNKDLKFYKAEPVQARKLVAKLLKSDPEKRFNMAEIMEDPWFAIGFKPQEDDYTEADSSESFSGEITARSLNAFEIVDSMSAGYFGLSHLVKNDEARENSELRFVSKQPVSDIVQKLEKIGKEEKFNMSKSVHNCAVNMRKKEGGKKGCLGVGAKISEVGPSLFAVEVSKNGGDTLEYKKFRDEKLKPSLKDIAWLWQGNGSENL